MMTALTASMIWKMTRREWLKIRKEKEEIIDQVIEEAVTETRRSMKKEKEPKADPAPPLPPVRAGKKK